MNDRALEERVVMSAVVVMLKRGRLDEWREGNLSSPGSETSARKSKTCEERTELVMLQVGVAGLWVALSIDEGVCRKYLGRGEGKMSA